MKPVRQNLALAIDGGGIKGVMVTRALMRLEEVLGRPLHEMVKLTAGTSTGAIIAAGIAHGMTAAEMHRLYVEFGEQVFPKSWRTISPIKFLVRYQYSSKKLIDLLDRYLGGITMGEIHAQKPDFNMVLTATDIYANTTRFIKLYKQRYADWQLRDAVMASSIVPTVFPVYEHDYKKYPDDPPSENWIPEKRYWLDGGVGSYSNPSYVGAYEVAFCLHDAGWTLENTTLISIGTGHSPLEKVWKQRLKGIFGGTRTPQGLFGPEWVFPAVDTFVQDAARQQIQLTRHFFEKAPAERAASPNAGLDFRRFNLTFDQVINMDDTAAIPELTRYGQILGEMIVNDQEEFIPDFACGGSEEFQSKDEGQSRAKAV